MRKRSKLLVFVVGLALAGTIATVLAFDARGQGSPAPIRSVDISGVGAGGDQTIAVGWGRNVSLFLRSDPNGPRATWDMGFEVDYVVLSQDGAWLLVVGNDRPLSPTSQGHVRLYGPIACAAQPDCGGWPLIFERVYPNSVWSGHSRPADLSRTGDYVAVGTGVIDYGTVHHVGMLYLYLNPRRPGSPVTWSRNLADWIQSVRFSGNFQTLSVGGFWNHTMWNYATSGLALRWTNSAVADPYYSVGPDFSTTVVATGHGIQDWTTLINGATGVEQWRQTEHGIQPTIAMSDAGDCYVAANSINDPGDYLGWFMYQSDGTLVWRYQVPASQTFENPVDAGVSGSDRVVLAGLDQTVYKWGSTGAGACAPPSTPTPFTMDPHLFVSDVAVTYNGVYGVVGAKWGEMAANQPNLYVFNTGGSGLSLQWVWLLG